MSKNNGQGVNAGRGNNRQRRENNLIELRNMLQPKRTKFRKAQKGRMKGLLNRGHSTF